MIVAAAENHTNGAPGRPSMVEVIDRARGKTDPPRERIEFDDGAPEGDETVRLLAIGPLLVAAAKSLDDVLRQLHVGAAKAEDSFGDLRLHADALEKCLKRYADENREIAVHRDELEKQLYAAREERDRLIVQLVARGDLALGGGVSDQIYAMREQRDRLACQLAGCGVAAMGGAADEIGPESYSYSASFGDVRKLRLQYEEAVRAINETLAFLAQARQKLASHLTNGRGLEPGDAFDHFRELDDMVRVLHREPGFA